MTSKFTDSENREWTLYLDINLARTIRNRLDVDVLDPQGGLSKLASDPILLVDTLYLICEEQCIQRKVSDEEFGRSLRGQSIEDATDALVEALTDFIPPRRRELLQSMTTAGEELQTMLTGLATERIPQAIRNLQSILGTSSPDSAESLVTTPDG